MVFLQVSLKLYQKNANLGFLDFLVSRNHCPKSRKFAFLTDFELQYLQWPPLAHEFFQLF